MQLFKNHDWVITGIVLMLLIISGVLIYSTTYNTEITTQGAGSFPRQLIFIAIGIIIYFGLIYFDIEWLKQKQVVIFIYILLLLSLIYLKLFAPEVAGTQRWIQLGFINFQPSEYAKLVIIITTPLILTSINLRIKEQIKRKIINTRFSLINILIDKNPQLFSYIISAAVVSPILFLVFIQPSLGNTIILGILWLLILFVSFSSKLQLEVIFTILIAVMTGGVLFGIVDLGSFYEKIGISLIIKGVDVLLLCISTLALLIISIKKIISPKSIIIGAVLGIIVFPIFSWTWENTLEDYQRERVETFIKGAETDRYGSGYQVTQSKIALGSGMLFGRGFLQGSQSSLRVLDFAYTDFIFASLGEQFGLTGTLFVLILYLILIIRIIQISISINDSFYSFVSMGVAIMILLNVFINTGMNMGILPVTGVPLPLVSYGGNSIIVNLIGLGIVQSLHARAHFLNKKSSAYSTDTISGINWSEIPLRT